MSFGAPILIIDDDPAITETVKSILEDAGLATVVASNGFHALKLAREIMPAVILCDWVMPQIAGSDIFRALASDPATSRIPRVLMTGHDGADRSCAHALLRKPFEAHHILALLRRVVAKAETRVQKNEALLETEWRG